MLRLLLVAGILTGNAPARAESVPIRNLNIEVPADVVQPWQLFADPSIPKTTFVASLRPTREMVLFNVEAATTGGQCAPLVDRMDGAFAAIPRVTAASLGLSAIYHPNVQLVTQPDGSVVRTGCLPLPHGHAMFGWHVNPNETAAMRAQGERLLDAVGAEYLAMISNAPRHMQTASGIAFDIRGREILWHVHGERLLRVGDPDLAANIVASATNHCEDELAAWRALQLQIVDRPIFAAPRFRIEVAVGTSGLTQVVYMCLDRRDGGMIELQWFHEIPDPYLFAATIRPVLLAIGDAYGTVTAEPIVPPPAPPPYAPDVVPMPIEPPLPDGGSGRGATTRQLAIGVAKLSPDAGRRATGGLVAFEVPMRPLGSLLLGELAASLGYDSASSIGVNARTGLGIPLLDRERIALFPSLGLGLDYLGGGKDDSYALDLQANLYLALGVRIGLFPNLDFDARVAKVFRHGPVDEIEVGTRFTWHRYGERTYVLDGFWRAYSAEVSATTFGALIGAGF